MRAFRGRHWLKPALALVLLGAAILLFFTFDEPLRRHFSGVKRGVMLQNEPMESLFRSEVAAIVAEIARVEGRRPVDAWVDEANKAIIPELNGLEVDLEATIDLVLNAPAEAKLEPVYCEIKPALRWEHYPSLPAYQGNPRKHALALMINVAWGEEHLPRLLQVLQDNGSRATFFLTGLWAEKNEELVCRIAEAGHELGNHGYSDAEVFPELDSWAISRSLRQTNEIIYDAAGIYPLYFTPHKGEFNDLTLELVSRHDMRTVLWTLDTVDWKNPGVKVMKDKILNHAAPGSIILMHPTADTITLLEEVLPLLQERQFKIITVGELLSPSWPLAGDGGRRGECGRQNSGAKVS